MPRAQQREALLRAAAGLGLALMLCMSAQASDRALPGMARIVTSGAQPDLCLSRVHIEKVDDKAVDVHDSGFDLEPGAHRLNGRAFIDAPACHPARGWATQPLPDLAADFEAGTTYHIGLDHASADARDWRLVIWKVQAATLP